MAIQKGILILIGVLCLSYVIMFLSSPRNVSDYVVVDTEYWRETGNSSLIKIVHNYNNEKSIESFPETLGEWRGHDYRYPDFVYTQLNANILMSRSYEKNSGIENDNIKNSGIENDNIKNGSTKKKKSIIWMDIINSKTGESFHKQRICAKGSGWIIDNESISEFNIKEDQNSIVKLRANRLDISKGGKKQVMVYWFMFKRLGFDNSVTMIRLTSPVRDNNTEKTFDIMRNFVEDQLFGTMYNNTEKKEITTAEDLINKYGDTGKVAMMMGVLIPLGIIFIGVRKK